MTRKPGLFFTTMGQFSTDARVLFLRREMTPGTFSARVIFLHYTGSDGWLYLGHRNSQRKFLKKNYRLTILYTTRKDDLDLGKRQLTFSETSKYKKKILLEHRTHFSALINVQYLR